MTQEKLTAEDLELWRLLEIERGRDSIPEFVPLMTRTYAEPRHLAPLIDVLYRVISEGGVRACVSVPPRHAKTETVLHFIAWVLMMRPDWTVGYVSYEAGLAQSKSRKARDLAQAAGVQIRHDTRAVREWRTTAGGGFLATGIGGPLTGHGLNLLVVDDPLKNREDAESATIRQNIHEWFTSTAMTRVEPGGSVLVIHTRWHPDDLIGRLAEDREIKWETINLPALADGKALWPERWSAEALDMRRREVGPYDWASLYLGEPRPKGTRVFGEPARWTNAVDLQGARIVIACDPAASEKTYADHSVILVMAAKGEGISQRAYVLDVERGRWPVTKLRDRLLEKQQRWGAPIVVEAVGGFKAVPQMLREMDNRIKVIEVYPTTDKFTRSLAVSAAWNDHRVLVPLEKPWLKDYLDEMRAFTGVKDAKDDQVDATAHAYNAINRGNPTVRRGVVAVGA